MIGLLIAIQFLTCLPLPIRTKLDAAAMGRSMRWFPAVGALIGALLAIADEALSPVLSPELRAALMVGLLVVITGGLHMDGLMDSCDALLAPVPAERRLEILWDSRVGSFAVVSAAAALLLKYAALLALPSASRVTALIAIVTLSRWAMVYATVRYPAARTVGLGHAYKAGAGARELAIASILALLGVIASGPAGLLAFALAWGATVLLARAIMSKIPGLTGDTYGAICESVEITVAIWLPVFHRALDGAIASTLRGGLL